MPNRLAHQTSPYLLQHAGNPVDWYPWGKEALERARVEDRPIFLSIGYSACHWCHVMEHESFEDAQIARLMNEHFVCIKVDREERPDLDQIYMNAVQIMTGRGGWPMSVFLTTDLKPFYGGTYWPPTARGGMPGFDQVLAAVADAWQNRRAQAIDQAESLTEHLKSAAQPPAESGPLSALAVEQAIASLTRSFDSTHGGFGGAPKFPHPMDLRLLARAWHRNRNESLLHVMTFTLDKMAAGGIYDQLGGGFHRYSVDERWLVPHFEKMLYDNALLIPCYLDAFLITGNADYARVARETCDYVLREMTDPAGGFYSTQDADSEGEEGKFFVWTPAEIAEVLGADAAKTFCRVYDVTPEGNFEHGHSILNRPKTLEQCAQILGRDAKDLARELAESRAKLLAVREKRVHPGLDDKVLVAWNGLMIDALAQAAGVLDEPRYREVATRAADFILSTMRRPDGRLLHTWRGGQAKLDAYLDDYASLANSLVSLYEATGNERWIDEAVRLVDVMLDKFADPAGGGFFYTASDHEKLLTRIKELTDSSVPSGNALAATALLRLGQLSGRKDYLDAATKTLVAATPIMQRAPMAGGQMLLALDRLLGPSHELVLVGSAANADARNVNAAIARRFLPRSILAVRITDANVARHHSPQLDELFAGRQSPSGEPVLYVCENFTCQEPAVGLAAILAAIEKLS